MRRSLLGFAVAILLSFGAMAEQIPPLFFGGNVPNATSFLQGATIQNGASVTGGLTVDTISQSGSGNFSFTPGSANLYLLKNYGASANLIKLGSTGVDGATVNSLDLLVTTHWTANYSITCCPTFNSANYANIYQNNTWTGGLTNSPLTGVYANFIQQTFNGQFGQGSTNTALQIITHTGTLFLGNVYALDVQSQIDTSTNFPGLTDEWHGGSINVHGATNITNGGSSGNPIGLGIGLKLGSQFDTGAATPFTSTASSISGNTLTVGGTVTGTPAVGQMITVPGGTRAQILASLGGSQYTISGSAQTISNAAITGDIIAFTSTASSISGNTLTVGGTVVGAPAVGQSLSIPGGTQAQITASLGSNQYTINGSAQTISSAAITGSQGSFFAGLIAAEIASANADNTLQNNYGAACYREDTTNSIGDDACLGIFQTAANVVPAKIWIQFGTNLASEYQPGHNLQPGQTTTLIGIAGTALNVTDGINLSNASFSDMAIRLPGGATGSVAFTALPTGTAATYACFTSAGVLVSSATAC
jgi:hypothetical protein